MSILNPGIKEAFIYNYGNQIPRSAGAGQVQTPPVELYFVAPQRVAWPFKPALGSNSSMNSKNWPPDASTGVQMAVMPHIRPLSLWRDATRTGGQAVLKPSTMASVPSVVVPTYSGGR